MTAQTLPPEAMEQMPELTPEAFLINFRGFALASPRASRGKVAPTHEEDLEVYVSEGTEQADVFWPEVLQRTDSRKVDRQREEFTKQMQRSARFVGLVALRYASDEVPDFLVYRQNNGFRISVLQHMTKEAIKTAEVLTDKSGNIAPTTWSAVRPHFRSAEDTELIANQYKDDPGLSFVVKALKDEPEDPERRLEYYRNLISQLSNQYPEESISLLRLAVIRKPKNPTELIEHSLSQRQNNPDISIRDALRLKPEEGSSKAERIEELKEDERFKDKGIPNYVFGRSITNHGNDPEGYLEWFLETREELLEEYNRYGIDVIHTALSEYYTNPREYLGCYIANLELLTHDPSYGFLSKRERHRKARDHPKDLVKVLASKRQAFLDILDEPRYIETFAMGTVRGVFAKSKNPERSLRYIYLKRKYPSCKKWVLNRAVEYYRDLDTSDSLIQRFLHYRNRARRTLRFKGLPMTLIDHICIRFEEPILRLDELSVTKNYILRKFGPKHGIAPIHRALSHTDPEGYMERHVTTKQKLLKQRRLKGISVGWVSKKAGKIVSIEEELDQVMFEMTLELAQAKFGDLSIPIDIIERASKHRSGPEAYFDKLITKISEITNNPKTSFLGPVLAADIVYKGGNVRSRIERSKKAFANLKAEFPDIDERIIAYAYREERDTKQFLTKVRELTDEHDLGNHRIVQVFGKSFLISAFTHYSNDPITFLESSWEIYEEIIKEEKYFELGKKVIGVSVLRGPSMAKARLDKILEELSSRYGDLAYSGSSSKDICEQLAIEYLSGKFKA